MSVTDEFGQVLIKTGVLEVDVGNAFFIALTFLGFKTFLDNMLLLQTCGLGYFLSIFIKGFIEVTLAH